MDVRRILNPIGHKTFSVGKYRLDIYALLANFSTMSNLVIGALISLFILIDDPLPRALSLRLIIWGAMFDAIDGRLARESQTKPRLGAQFDTAADLSTFAFAPAFMIIHMFYSKSVFLAFLLAAIYLFSASFRLSRFMLEPTYGYFKGMPSPVSATFIATWYIIDSPDYVFAAGTIAVISVVMVTSLPYTGMKQVTTRAQLFYFVFTVVFMLLFMFGLVRWYQDLATVWIVYIIYFTSLGPLHGYHSIRKQKKDKEAKNELES
ncbi:MAG: CDP-alcohol phosphatidyltransferase family protein [Candidatus Kariarchaeaceae archaeon]|jgi:CDP-diacylglycerol--serine O-phosphatidyltransferase